MQRGLHDLVEDSLRPTANVLDQPPALHLQHLVQLRLRHAEPGALGRGLVPGVARCEVHEAAHEGLGKGGGQLGLLVVAVQQQLV